MKNILLFFVSSLLSLFSFSVSYAAETVYIPDANFKAALIAQGVDTNEDNEIEYDEAAAVTHLDVSSYSIADMTGIEFFMNLIVLNCYSNDLTSIDIENLTVLQEFRCFDNQLSSLDVSANTDLIKLFCYDNPIMALDVSSNTQLTHLYCMNNQLTSLDVSTNTALQYLYCYDNSIPTIDISANTDLIHFFCYNNLLTSLDISGNPDLENLRCHGNQLTELNVTGNPALTDLMCSANLITELDLTNNPELQYLLCGNNQLTSLNLSNNTNLISISMGGMPELVDICVWELPFPPEGVILDTTGSPNILFSTDCMNVNIPDANLKEALINLGVDTNDDSEISYGEAKAEDSLDVHAENIADMTGIEAFVNLTFLWCYSNELTTLDISSLTALTDIDCGDNQLTSLDVSANTELLELRCYSNQLTSLDISVNTNLTYIDCGNNELTNLDVSANTSLKMLLCYVNNLSTLDISGNTNLEFLNISGMSSLNLVCVWELPFPPAGTTVDDHDSPNVVYSTSCTPDILQAGFAPENISVYPNPAVEALYIHVSGTDHYMISITTLNGQRVYSGIGYSGEESIQLDSFIKGLYILKVLTTVECYSFKISIL